MAGRIVAKAVVEVDNVLSDTDESGSYIEIEVDSDGNEIVAGTTSNQHDGMTATVRTSSASVGVTKAVAWPPKGPSSGRKGDGMGEIISSAAKKYVRSVESNNTEQLGQYTLSRELFRPGKMNLDDVWRPNQQENYPEETITKTQTPRRTIRTLSDVLQPDHHSGFTKPSSYYVPPGTSRTRKAQEGYTKHLEVERNERSIPR